MGASKRRKAETERLKRVTTGLSNHRIYHGTIEPIAQRILSGETLRPRGDDPSNWSERNLSSRRECVYLTDLYGVHYACRAIFQTTERPQDYCPSAAIIELDYTQLDHDNLLADEDFMALVNWAANHEGKSPEEHREEYEETVRHYATHDAGAHKVWRKSLTHLRTVAHRGEISRSAITRIAIISASAMIGLRLHTYKSEDLWKVLFNPTPENPTETQQFQARLTHTIFDNPHPEIRVISL